MDEKKTQETAEVKAEETKTPTVADLQAEIEKLKKAISASNSDAAERKREAKEWQDKYKSTLDEQKRKELEAEEAIKQIKAENEVFKAEKRVAAYTAKLLAAGFDQTTASAMATGLPDGVPDSFFESQKAFLETKTQEIKTQTINSQPGLSTGLPPSTQKDAKSAEDAKYRHWMGLK